MAPWWLRSADDAPAIEVIDTTDDNPFAEIESGESKRVADAVESEDSSSPPKRNRRRRRRRRAGTNAPSTAPEAPKEPKATKPNPVAATKSPNTEAAEQEVSAKQPKPAETPVPPSSDAAPRPRRRRRSKKTPQAIAGTRAQPEPKSEDLKAKRSTEPTPAEATRISNIPTPNPVPPPTSSHAAPVHTNDLTDTLGGSVVYIPNRSQDERKIAMFFDFENIALGVRDTKDMTFEVGLVLARLLEKGKIIVKRAYADWQRYAEFKRPLHEAAIEMIDIPKKRYSGKNSADIKMVVDAMDLCYAKEHLDTFVLVSGDSDFSPLVSKLKENDKYVIGLGMKGATSQLLVDNCDEFIYYEDVWRDAQHTPRLDHVDTKKSEAFQLMAEAMQALIREDKDVLWGSMIKQTMKRKRPSFNEGYYGYSTFSELLEDAEKKGIIRLRRDQRSGGYIVTGFALRSSADVQ